MTRNKLAKAKIILAYSKKGAFTTTGKITKEQATEGTDYYITYDYYHYYKPADGNKGSFDYNDGKCTHFNSYYEAREYLIKHKEEIVAAAKFCKWFRNRGIGETTAFKEKRVKLLQSEIKIECSWNVFYDPYKKRSCYNRNKAEKWYANHVIIHRSSNNSYDPIENTRYYTITPDEDSLFIEYFKLEKNENGPYLAPNRKVAALRFFNKKPAISYEFLNNKYVEIPNGQLYAEDDLVADSWARTDRLMVANDLTWGESDETQYRGGDFNEKTQELVQRLGFPKICFGGYYNSFDPSYVTSLRWLFVACLPRRSVYSSGETQICKGITDYLANIPFDAEHTVVKYKNGYILRLGKIAQAWEYEYEYRTGTQTRLTSNPPEKDEKSRYHLIYEEYVEFARLFVNNTLSTRSLSLAHDGGRQWRHDGIHLVYNLFQDNPPESHLGVDIVKQNTEALKTLYTVHPKLKYMKKYMEKHPDVLYNSCVPFLRALFQYDMIIETFIALGKDDIFWTETDGGSSYGHYSWRCHGNTYKKTKESFSIDDFVETLGLKSIPQRGDFYQRLGMTKQQFKLIFEDTDKWEDIMKGLNSVCFPVPGHRGTTRLSYEREILRTVSWEDFRLVVEMIKMLMGRGDATYSIANSINSLFQFYGTMPRVYKALVTRQYDAVLCHDYLNMRRILIEGQCPDFKVSIWDWFPDDNDDLRRSHDRIMFIYNEFQAAKDLRQRDVFSSNMTTNDIYLYCKDHHVPATSINHVVDSVLNVRSAYSGILSTKDFIKDLPESAETFTEWSEKINTKLRLILNLYSLYWDDSRVCSWHGDRETRRAIDRWKMEYKPFVLSRLASNLDYNKYDLYLTLRRRFIDNMTNFDENKYPYVIEKQETLDALYTELSAQEPRLNEIIAEREREHRRQIEREAQERTAAQQQKYVERYKALKKFNFDEDPERCIIVPENLVSLIVEGQSLHHCVGSFVDAVSEGKNTIVFLRKKNDVETPYVTVSLQPNGKEWFIDQAHGDRNSDISTEDVAFLKVWGAKNGIILDSIKTHYGALGHN